ncbi:hypothetical protein [Ichthyobacterium seriolicida]|uniref:Uncharacterized protein n=1 Tax=Ichthyobacterium seriolicida TaxID=242600 RepID=A0A1J1EB24_9FLAO|nr:hypothetical protein [Ichthyobacterium seriolicida]BAV95139.1 hypothetical protein JBKA6_1126 [Ichthyobacterium seriolicida]
MVFIHDTPSNLCDITKFALKKASDTSNNNGNGKIKNDQLTSGVLVLTSKQSTGNGDTNATPIEYEFKKADHATDSSSGLAANDILKVDGMILPNGATISTENDAAESSNSSHIKNPIEEGITIDSSPATKSIYFKIVAQDGETQKFYKFTYTHS